MDMIWIAPPDRDQNQVTLEKRLWASADQFRANSGLKAQEYSSPILGIIFLCAYIFSLPATANIPRMVNAELGRGCDAECGSGHTGLGELKLTLQSSQSTSLRRLPGLARPVAYPPISINS